MPLVAQLALISITTGCWLRLTVSRDTGETIQTTGGVAGRARERDILPCCVSAFIDAASNAAAVRSVRATRAAQARAA